MNSGRVASSLYSYAYPVMGSGIFEEKSLSTVVIPDTVYSHTAFIPYTGTLYFGLVGINNSYRFSVERQYIIPEIPESPETIIQVEPCETFFGTYRMGESEKTEFYVQGPAASRAGMLFFRSDNRPFMKLDPVEKNYFWLYRSSSSPSYTAGLFLDSCDPGEEENRITLTVKKEAFNPVTPDFLHGEIPESGGNNSYIGYFNTDLLFVENWVTVIPDKSGTLFAVTAPWPSYEEAKVFNTMVFLYDSHGKLLAQNTDMLGQLGFNRFSYVRFPVKTGETYQLKVTPFMDKDSDIKAMNIRGNYILDINLKEQQAKAVYSEGRTYTKEEKHEKSGMVDCRSIDDKFYRMH